MSLEIYTRNRVIGQGSYGEVWLVRHKKDKKQYVLKKMELKNASRRERKAAEQEAKLLSKLKHPNIVSYKDSFETDDGYLYIAMGYCEGGDLYTRLKEMKGTPLEERQVVEWFVQIAMALQYMHERNILHRDLKTQNIFLTKSKIIKVGDLGIARVLDNSSDMATTLIGTPYYMSPELFSNKPYNHKSDVWALGCCVYEMATLKHAFNAKDMNSLVYKILRGKTPIMPKIYSPELVTLIKAMLHQDPDKRPSVNRILRDPYIKRNIAIFLEGTKRKKPNRPESAEAASRRRSSQSSEVGDATDGSRPSSAKPLRSRTPINDENLEPLNVAKPLEPIQEDGASQEDLGGSGSSQHSVNARRAPTPSNRSRSSTPSQAEEPRPLPSKDRSSRPVLGQRRRSKPPETPQIVVDIQDYPDNNKPVLQKAKPVAKPRPLPPCPDGDRLADRGQAAAPKKSKSPSRPADRGESGYNSNSANSSTNSSRDENGSHRAGAEDKSRYGNKKAERQQEEPPAETPRGLNLSARQRRRERKESETPRPPTSRSVDIEQKRRYSESDAPRIRRSADNAPVLINQKKAPASRRPTNDRPAKPAPREALRKQPSVNDDSSSSDTEEEGISSQERDRRRRKPNQVPNQENRKSPDTENEEKEREMNDFIHQLDTTLQMNKEEENSDEEKNKKKRGLGVVPEDGVIEELDEEPDQKRPQIIETIRGKTLSASGRLMDRIAILRKDCIRGLGYEKLKRAYDILENIDGDELEPQLVELLGPADFELYAGKIWQLKFCEDSAFGLN